MSRFFATGSDSESESSSGESVEAAPQKIAAPTRTFQFSDDEEDTKRVVRRPIDKWTDELKGIMKQMKNHKKIKDMSKTQTCFENMTKVYGKSKQILEEETGSCPRFYIRCLVELESFISECWEDKEGKKAMNKNNFKALTSLRQKLRKYNKDFEADINSYKENPDVGEEVEDEEAAADADSDDDSDDGEEGGGSFAAASFLKKDTAATGRKDAKVQFEKGARSDSESDDDWGSDDESDSSSSSGYDNYEGDLAAKFLKRTDEAKEQREAKKVAQKEERERRRKAMKDELKELKEKDDEDEEGWEKVTGGVAVAKEKPKMFGKDDEINHASVVKKFNEILTARGKRKTDRNEQIELLCELRGISTENNLGAGLEVKILFSIIAAVFDYNPNVATCMKPEKWQKCLDYIQELLTLLVENKNIVVGEHISEEQENVEDSERYLIRACVLTAVEKMDTEFTKMLQACDAHSTEYVERLKDEKTVCFIMEQLEKYVEERGNSQELCRIYLKRIEHTYYKFDYSKGKKRSKVDMFDDEETRAAGDASNGEESKIQADLVEEESRGAGTKVDSEEEMSRWCRYIYKQDTTDRIRTRAMLCQVYHLALHDHWYEARDLMLMSHLQDTIQHSDIPSQILYNRTMVQLGLCAFRHGMVRDAHNALIDIQSGGRAKEMLAQGLLLQRQHERNAEQEKVEKRRQVPFHMHINLELLECVYLVSAMLLEIPYMAAHEYDAKRRLISKSFHHQLKISEKQTLIGPPENMREHVVAASKAMKIGDWKACVNFIINEKMNTKVWDLFPETGKVRSLLQGKIQEESLRTYLFTYASIYDSLSLATLCEQFELEPATVHSIISKMIINEELMASLDQPTLSIVMHRTEPTRLQSMALQLSDKIANLVDNNERILEMKSGNFFQFGKDRQDQQRQGGYRQRNYGQDNWMRSGGRRN